MKWYLINNNSHNVKWFSSQKKLKRWARDRHMTIKRSYTDSYCFYIESQEYIPADYAPTPASNILD